MAEHVTFWRMKVKPGKLEELRQLMTATESDDRLRGNGWVASIVGSRKDNPEEVWGAVTWDTSERYYKNAESAAQNTMYQKIRALLSADPDWYDCDVIDEDRQG